jgi:ATP-binding cassette subfamily F protein 3
MPEPPRAAVVAAVAEKPSAPPPAKPSSFKPTSVRAASPKPAATAPAATRDDRKNAKQARARQSEATRPLRMELQRIDERLARLAGEKAKLEVQLSRPATAGDDYAELGRNLAHAAAETAVLEERWLELQAELESLQPSS